MDDIASKLASLPEGLVEENIQSWQHVAKLYELFTSLQGNRSQQMPLYDLVQTLCKSEQAKLFRAGVSVNVLMISTKEKNGLEKGDAYIFVAANLDNIEAGYFTATAHEAEVITCKNDEIMPILQPLLDRLWNETRGKKNA